MRFVSRPISHLPEYGFPLTRAQFFGKLTDLFTSRKGSDHGSIFLVQKRCSSLSDPQAHALDSY